MSEVSSETAAIGIGLYGGLLVFMVVSFSRTICRRESDAIGGIASTVRNVFRGALTLFVAVRIAWLGLVGFYPDKSDLTFGVVEFILNRFALLAYFTSFTLVVFYWAERYHKRYYDTNTFLPGVGKGFVIVNTVIYAFQFVIIGLFLASNEQRENNPIYDINILADVFLSATVSVAFFIYGWMQFCRLSSLGETEVETRRTEIIKVLAITVVFAACFLLRVAMFLYRPVTDRLMDERLFCALAYFVPELCPSVLQVYLSETVNEKNERDTKFIDRLYAENESDIADDREARAAALLPPTEDTRLVLASRS